MSYTPEMADEAVLRRWTDELRARNDIAEFRSYLELTDGIKDREIPEPNDVERTDAQPLVRFRVADASEELLPVTALNAGKKRASKQFEQSLPMRYRRLGNSAFRGNELCRGTMNFGSRTSEK